MQPRRVGPYVQDITEGAHNTMKGGQREGRGDHPDGLGCASWRAPRVRESSGEEQMRGGVPSRAHRPPAGWRYCGLIAVRPSRRLRAWGQRGLRAVGADTEGARRGCEGAGVPLVREAGARYAKRRPTHVRTQQPGPMWLAVRCARRPSVPPSRERAHVYLRQHTAMRSTLRCRF